VLNLLEWWNFMFILPIVSGLVLAFALSLTGAVGESGDADGEFGEFGNADGDFGDANTDAEFGDDGHGSEHSTSAIGQVLGFFGLGQGIPLSVMLPILFLSQGLSGILLNRVLAGFLPLPAIFAPISLAISILLAAIIGQGLGKAMRPLFVGKSSSITSKDLLGSLGKVVYTVSPTGGVVHVKDRYGNIHRLSCRGYPNSKKISPGSEVLVLEYLPKKGIYYVEHSDITLERRKDV